MKGALCVLVLALPALILGAYIDDNCGQHVYISYDRTFYIRDNLSTDCKVHFDRYSTGKTILTITGSNLDCSTCHVNVNGGSDLISKTGGSICSSGYFSRTVKSDNLGELYLHVRGQCQYAGLTFTVKEGCSSYHVGAYVGVSIGCFFFVCVIVVAFGVCYRRRVVLVRRPVIIPAGQTVVTQGIPAGQIGEEEIKYVRDNFLKKYAANIKNGVYDERDLSRLRIDDVYVTTFIRGPQRLDEGVDLVHESLRFRKEMNVNDITEDSFEQWVWDRQALFFHNRTKSGHKILFLRVKEHKKDANLLPVVKKFFLYWLEKAFRENPLERVVCLFDMSDAGLSNLDMDLIRFILTCFKQYYPTLLEKLLIYEMPWIFNAAWKVIKTWLSQEAISKIKFVTKSDAHTYIDRDQLFEHMGGTAKFDSVQYYPAEAGDATSSGIDGTSVDRKRVTFSDASDSMETNANNSAASPVASPRASPNNMNMSANDGGCFTGRLLTISPAEELLFVPDESGREPYDIKTTAPEKYRVRPSTGIVKAGQAYEVHVYLQPGYLGTVNRDKFLVMAMEVTGDSYDTSLWKTVPKDSIMEHRLRCSTGNQGQHAYNVNVTMEGGHCKPAPVPVSNANNSKLEMLIESNNQLRRRVGWLIISHIVLFILTMVFFTTFICFGDSNLSSYLYFPFGFSVSSSWGGRHC
ncbi:hypothetical protein BaRGS_00012138 [Batillaria attramentaria]|uniref:Motile sperm domain-containing protein 2 n=1 Tax=Batillaria attramentaria TaxID=370345 RepID=A0ABD0LB64_9CAEN